MFGLRFRVLVILPLSIVGGALIGAATLLMGHSAMTVLAEVATFGVALQVGYLFGSLSRFTLAAARAARTAPSRSEVKVTR